MPDSVPPNGLPVYRILTGPDDAAFCHRVSEALALGYRLYGSPAATFNGQHVIVAPFPKWVPADVREAASRLTEAEALARLSPALASIPDSTEPR